MHVDMRKPLRRPCMPSHHEPDPKCALFWRIFTSLSLSRRPAIALQHCGRRCQQTAGSNIELRQLPLAGNFSYCTVPNSGQDALLFGSVAVLVTCVLQGKLSAVWVLIAGARPCRRKCSS